MLQTGSSSSRKLAGAKDDLTRLYYWRLQLIMEGVDSMNERILDEQRQRELRPASKMALLSSMLLPAPAAVLKAKRAFKRDMLSKDLTIKAQLVGLWSFQERSSRPHYCRNAACGPLIMPSPCSSVAPGASFPPFLHVLLSMSFPCPPCHYLCPPFIMPHTLTSLTPGG